MNPAGLTIVRQGQPVESESLPDGPADRRHHFARLAAARAWAELEDPRVDPVRLRDHLLAAGARGGRQMRSAVREYRRLAEVVPGAPAAYRLPELASPSSTIAAHVGRRCRYCGAPAAAMDHVWPRTRGGDDHPNNLVPACLTCNSTKGGRSILGDRCQGCGEERHPGDVDTANGDAFYHCRCGRSWRRRWDLQAPRL